WSFKLAENLFPANRLIINDSTPNVWSVDKFRRTRTPYYMQIERAMLKGARIDGIGMQFHMFYRREDELASTAGYYDPEQFMNVLDTYAALGLPLHVTEMTIPAYSAAPEDEAVQAEIVRNLYRMLFSHPAVEGIIYWNTADGYAYVRETAGAGDMSAGENYYYGGLLRHDLSVKPAWNVIRNLFTKEWRTDLELYTDTDRLSFKGFFGRYEFEVTANGKTVKQEFHLGKDLPRYFTVTI
ncbi:MAG: endo-1,4-beta-xylanase, partial [Lentisphaeria bacterium]|nr:endo-1,4-beta-xylanase [Lentisphaeria bacterium]